MNLTVVKSSKMLCFFAVTMDSALNQRLDDINHLCRQFQVKRLIVFGSALRADFDPERSDTDFIVEFEPLTVELRMRNLLQLRIKLAELLHRPVDLIEEGAIQNPYIQESVRNQQQILYAA